MRRPWNITIQTIYSLVTLGADGFNMNICSYVSPASLQPKRYLIALDPQTLSARNFRENGAGVLQILHEDACRLVHVLGRKSGRNLDKIGKLGKMELLDTWNSFPVLMDSCAYIRVQVDEVLGSSGDHDLFLCNVKGYRTLREDGVLTQQRLIEQGLIL